MKKLTLLTLAVAGVLTGCGGGSSDSGSNAAVTPSIQGKSLDGYLVNAEVYVDRNQNNTADPAELLQLTTENGLFQLPVTDTKYPVIVRAVAGKTFDSDKGGYLTQTFELYAAPGQTIVSPYTTLAKAKGMSLNELAAELNLPENVLSADYIAAKQDTESRKQAQKVHLVARSLTRALPETVTQTVAQKAELTTASQTILGQADQLEGNEPDALDDRLVVLDDQGNASVTDMPPGVRDALEGKTFYAVSTNPAYFKSEGLTRFSFNNSQVTMFSDAGEAMKPVKISYTSKGYHSAGGIIDETLVYASDNLSLVTTKQGDLQFYSVTDFNNGYPKQAFDKAQLTGKTWYYFFDESGSKNPDVVDAVFSFSPETNSVTISSLKDSFDPTTTSWTLDNGSLVLKKHSDWSHDLRISLTTLNSEELYLVYQNDATMGTPRFMTTNHAVAKTLLKTWK